MPQFGGSPGLGPMLSANNKMFTTFQQTNGKYLGIVMWKDKVSEFPERFYRLNCMKLNTNSKCYGYSLAYLPSRNAVVLGATLVD